ncbi:MAG TPA: protein kinase [Vicinamibacterales bacterium]|nr:protein kinase [Vicinamibacterales bacterium]
MTPRRWQQIERLFHDALERPPEERAAFLDRSCAGDESLRREVNALLDSPATANQFLDRDALEVAASLLSVSKMPVLSGRRLGLYQLQERIGSGGMGEIYRAHDTRLGRDVAIKILPQSFSADPNRQARFEREARVLAALNHPNIGAVYGFEEGVTESGETVRGIVLELIEGETLSERLRRRPLPIGEALVIAKQIADALDVAHEKGIVHRDLKPANIKIAPDSVVKVLDFGLAKTIADNASFTESVVAPFDEAQGSPEHRRGTGNTVEGAILGTAAYMSPEQARGQTVDKRTDIWAFGCVLFEMLTGRAPFVRETTSDTIAAILEAAPDWQLLPPSTPPNILRLLERCLTKDMKRRIRDIADARIEIEEPIARTQPAPATHATRRSLGTGLTTALTSRRLAWCLAASAVVIAGAVLAWRLRPDASPRDLFAGATFKRLTDWDGAEQQVAISRDGKFVAFISDRSGTWDAWVGQIGADSFSNLTNGRVPDLRNHEVPNVAFTPDGTLVTLWVRLWDPENRAQSNGWTVPTIGGQLRPYMDRYVPNMGGADWSADGRRLVYHTGSPGDPMFVHDLEQGTDREILVSKPGVHNHAPRWSPDGAFIYFVRGFPPDQMDVWRIHADGGAPERLTFHDSRVLFPTFLDSRTLLYLATADDGSGPWVHALNVEWRVSQRLNTGVDPYTSIAASADGQRIVGAVSRPTSGLWRATIGDRPIDESRAVRVTLPTAHGLSPRFGPDYMLYRASTSGTDGLWKLGEGDKPTELWNGRDGRIVAAPAIAPNGQQFVFPVRRGRVTRLQVMNADGSGVRQLTEALDVRGSPAWSPDGQWIAVAANRDGQPALFKVPVNGGTPVLLVAGFALDPVWSPSSRFLIYSGTDVGTTFTLKAVAADGSPYPLPEIVLSRGARRVAFLDGDDALVILKGDVSYKELWVRDLKTGRERQLTALGRGFTIGDFDISQDGRELLFDRSRDESDVVLIERPK